MKIFKLPDLGEGLPDAEIHEWYVKEGDFVKIDQPIASMETAKAVVDVPSPYEGRITKLYGQPGDIIQTGSPLVAYESTTSEKTGAAQDAGTVVGSIQVSDAIIEEAPVGTAVKTTASTIKATPAVRMLAAKLHVDLTQVKPSGPQGTITLNDVNQAVKPSSTPLPASAGETLHGARRAMAMSMAKAHAEVAAATYTEDADIYLWPAQTDITVRLLQAIVAACQTEPSLNAHFDGQAMRRQILKEINLGIAIDTLAGLYVPVLKDIENKPAEQLREEINQFKTKAKNQSFTPADLQGTTIMLSNFGTISGRYATPVLVPPIVAIIAIGKTRNAVVPHHHQPAIHPIMPVSLTFDHRIITGGEAARFLAAFITHLEKAD